MAHEHNEQSTDKKQNLARFFIEQQHVAWVSLAVALLWGIYGLLKMPQRKDPDIPVRQAMVIVPWQGTSAEQVEQLVTRKDRAGHCFESVGDGDQERLQNRFGDGPVRAGGKRKVRPGQGTGRRQDQAGRHPRPSAGRRSDSVHQGLRGYVCIDAHSSEPAGRSSPGRLGEQAG